MKYSELKKIKTFCNELTSQPDWREVVENIIDGETDFEVDNVRFINTDNILEIMVDEIFSDNYILGCFNAGFIAGNSDLNYELVKACQSAEAYEAIGTALNNTMTQDDKENFCAAYASADGYGHHFNHYDFGEEELPTTRGFFHIFDNQ